MRHGETGSPTFRKKGPSLPRPTLHRDGPSQPRATSPRPDAVQPYDLAYIGDDLTEPGARPNATTTRGLLRCLIAGHVGAGHWGPCWSDGWFELEYGNQPEHRRGVDSNFVVAAADVVEEGATSAHPYSRSVKCGGRPMRPFITPARSTAMNALRTKKFSPANSGSAHNFNSAGVRCWRIDITPGRPPLIASSRSPLLLGSLSPLWPCQPDLAPP